MKKATTSKNVMVKAWNIARNAQKKFGGSVKQYFSMALKQAWYIVKTIPVYQNLKNESGISLDKVTFYDGKVKYAVNENADFEWFDSVIEAMNVFKSWIQEAKDNLKSHYAQALA